MIKYMLSSKNSAWGVQKDGLGNQFYNHIIDFPNDINNINKNNFLKKEVGFDPKKLVDMPKQANPLQNSNKATFMVSLKDYQKIYPNESLESMLNKDFMVMYNDETDHFSYWAVEGSKIANNTIQIVYEGTRDWLFEIGIDKLFRNDRDVVLNRGMVDNVKNIDENGKAIWNIDPESDNFFSEGYEEFPDGSYNIKNEINFKKDYTDKIVLEGSELGGYSIDITSNHFTVFKNFKQEGSIDLTSDDITMNPLVFFKETDDNTIDIWCAGYLGGSKNTWKLGKQRYSYNITTKTWKKYSKNVHSYVVNSDDSGTHDPAVWGGKGKWVKMNNNWFFVQPNITSWFWRDGIEDAMEKFSIGVLNCWGTANKHTQLDNIYLKFKEVPGFTETSTPWINDNSLSIHLYWTRIKEEYGDTYIITDIKDDCSIVFKRYEVGGFSTPINVSKDFYINNKFYSFYKSLHDELGGSWSIGKIESDTTASKPIPAPQYLDTRENTCLFGYWDDVNKISMFGKYLDKDGTYCWYYDVENNIWSKPKKINDNDLTSDYYYETISQSSKGSFHKKDKYSYAIIADEIITYSEPYSWFEKNTIETSPPELWEASGYVNNLLNNVGFGVMLFQVKEKKFEIDGTHDINFTTDYPKATFEFSNEEVINNYNIALLPHFNLKNKNYNINQFKEVYEFVQASPYVYKITNIAFNVLDEFIKKIIVKKDSVNNFDVTFEYTDELKVIKGSSKTNQWQFLTPNLIKNYQFETDNLKLNETIYDRSIQKEFLIEQVGKLHKYPFKKYSLKTINGNSTDIIQDYIYNNVSLKISYTYDITTNHLYYKVNDKDNKNGIYNKNFKLGLNIEELNNMSFTLTNDVYNNMIATGSQQINQSAKYNKQNLGFVEKQNKLSTAKSYANAAGSIISAFFTGDIGSVVNSGMEIAQTNLDNQKNLAAAKNDIAQLSAKIGDAQNSPNQLVGNGDDLTGVLTKTNLNAMIFEKELWPTLKKKIGWLIQMQGVSLGSLPRNINNYLQSRYHFNYIEAQSAFENYNEEYPLTNEVRQIINKSLSTGLTIWHYRRDDTWKGIKNYNVNNVETKWAIEPEKGRELAKILGGKL